MIAPFGWTEDPAILSVLDGEVWHADYRILTNRKDGGVHNVWVWPLGTFDDDSLEEWHAAGADPCWSRVDLAWGRYFNSGCTFLIWEECSCRAGTLEDAQLFVRALNNDTPRTRRREEHRQWAALVADLRLYAGAQVLLAPEVAGLVRRTEAYRSDPRWPELSQMLEAVTTRVTLSQHDIWMHARKPS